jgi:hypothetical protein
MAEKMSESEKKKEDWMNSKWRPMMGWMYMGVCIFDFVVAPVLWSLTQAMFHGGVNVQWQPLTLQGAGLFHISMGAVLGLAAYGRTQEKLAGANNGGITLPPNVGTTYTPPPAVGQQPSNFGAPVATTITQSFGSHAPVTNSWGSQPLGVASGMGTSTADVTAGWGGKKAPPVITDFPER